MEEVDAEPVDLAGELVKAIELRLARAPIICIGPVLTDILNPSQRRALAPVVDQLRMRPARAPQSRFEISKHIVADIDAKRLDHAWSAFRRALTVSRGFGMGAVPDASTRPPYAEAPACRLR